MLDGICVNPYVPYVSFSSRWNTTVNSDYSYFFFTMPTNQNALSETYQTLFGSSRVFGISTGTIIELEIDTDVCDDPRNVKPILGTCRSFGCNFTFCIDLRPRLNSISSSGNLSGINVVSASKHMITMLISNQTNMIDIGRFPLAITLLRSSRGTDDEADIRPINENESNQEFHPC